MIKKSLSLFFILFLFINISFSQKLELGIKAGPNFATQKLNNIVMLGTPNQTSIVAKTITKWMLGRKLLGMSVENGLTGILPPWDGKKKLGIIAGYFPVGSELVTPIIKNPNDGTVSIEETRLDGSKDHITLNCSHLGLLFSKKVFLQTKHFLEHSCFIHN